MKRVIFILLIFMVALKAEIPQTLNYQGILTDNSGVIVPDGSYDLTFNLYNVETAGSALWTESQTVQISGGIINVILGKITLLNLPFDTAYWLGISVDSGSEMVPRIELTSSAYSLKSQGVVDSSITGASIENNEIVRSVNNRKDDITISAGDNIVVTQSSDSLIISTVGLSGSPWNQSASDIYFDGTGNVGIGVATPDIRLDVRSLGADEAALMGVSNWDASHYLYLFGGRQNDPNPFLMVNGNDPLLFANTAGGYFNEWMRLTGEGNLGIGTSTPSTKLEVADTIYASSGGFKFPDGTVQTTAASGSGNGDITGVTAGNGLSGGGLSGDVTLNADFAGTGASSTIARSDHNHNTSYVNEGQSNSITSTMIVDGTVNASDLQDGTALQEIADDDGPGSGLNADYLDNLHASSFMSTSMDNWVNTSGDVMTGRLTNNSNDGVLFTGTYGSGTIPASGAGTRLMWYPRKSSFRAGLVSNDEWNDANIGLYSIAVGHNTEAVGNGSVALGYYTRANASTSTALGNNTVAGGMNSTALGSYTVASGLTSTTMGGLTSASGDYTTAMGYNNDAQSYMSLAIGRYNADSGTTGSWVDQELILSIGDGTSTSARSNSLTFSKNGYMWIQGTLTQNSDQNLKQNIQPLNNAIQNLKQIKGVSYQWKDTKQMGNQTEIGVIAQDVEKVYPELVGENEGYKTTNYIGLVPVLIEAVKEQQKMIEQLQKRISELENI